MHYCGHTFIKRLEANSMITVKRMISARSIAGSPFTPNTALRNKFTAKVKGGEIGNIP